MEGLARQAKSRKKSVALLFDTDASKEANRLSKKYDDSGKIESMVSPREILMVEDAFEVKSPRCVEDILPKDIYLQAVNSYYKGLFPEWKEISPKKDPFKEPAGPIAEVLEQYFKGKEGLDGVLGDFDKIRAAREAAFIIQGERVPDKAGPGGDYEGAHRLLGMIQDVLAGKEPERITPKDAEKAKATPKEVEVVRAPKASARTDREGTGTNGARRSGGG